MALSLLELIARFVILLGGAALVVESQSATIEVDLSQRVPHVGDNVTFTCMVTGVGNEAVLLLKVVTKPEDVFVTEQIALNDVLIGVYKNLGRFSVLKTTDGDAQVLKLTIRGVQFEDSGNYGCSVPTVDDLYKVSMLDVYRKPTNVSFVNHANNSVVVLRENEKPNFECRVPDVLPIPKIQIFLERELVSPKDITHDFLVGSELNVLCSGTQSDKKCPLHLSYTMVATNRDFNVSFIHHDKALTCVAKMKDLEMDEMSSTIRLTVHYPPKFVCAGVWNGTVNMTDLRIICQVYANPPSSSHNKTVSINTMKGNFILIRVGENSTDYSLKDSPMVGTDVSVTQLEFVIKTVSDEHFEYEYHFSASNYAGSSTKSIRIENTLTPIIDGAETNVSRLSLIALSLIFVALFGRL